MTWITLFPIIVRYGLPFAMKLWDLANRGGDPTPEEWAELEALAMKDAEDYLNAARGRANS